MAETVVNIVEPTLESEAGHCHSFVASFCGGRGTSGCVLRLFAGRGARLPHLADAGIRVYPYFRRRLRRLQAFLLFRRLLREPGRIFLPTATRTDLAILSLAAGGVVPPRKAYLFFHWLRADRKKRRSLARMARIQPHAVVLCPTESVAAIFRECGFGHALAVPYPITPAGPDGEWDEGFTHLLFAGAARVDKGFPAVVDLVALMNERGMALPVAVQASGDHYGRHEPRVREEIDRLEKIGYPRLALHRQTLRDEEYRRLFRGAVCLQPYDPADFADRVSGVTLDAFSHGCPVVTRKGTWMGRVVERFGAGIAVDADAPERLLAAAEEIVREYGRFRENALLAGREMQRELSASRLFKIVAA